MGDYTPDGIGLNELFSGQFRHVTPSFNITTPNGVLPGTNDVNIVSTGGTSQVTGLTLTGFIAALAAPHKFYLGLISACF